MIKYLAIQIVPFEYQTAIRFIMLPYTYFEGGKLYYQSVQFSADSYERDDKGFVLSKFEKEFFQ